MVVGLPKGGRRVLLADDDAVVQEVVRCAAAKVGHQVTAATTGVRALELAVSMQPDLIVLDIQFPDADGRDVLAQLKRDPRTVQIPVIVWSCRPTSDSDSRIALDLGAEDYVEKSDVQGLIRKLERVLLRFERSG